jgi:ectoine hydroxylase-related dioxygenase (phytanoyl-CoA dioxygenase family)
MATATEISAAHLKDEFAERGFVILRGIIEPEVVEDVRDAMNTLVDDLADRLCVEGRIQDKLDDEGFETRLYKLYENFLEDSPRRFRENLQMRGTYGLFYHPRLLDVVEVLLGPEIRLYPNYTVRPKFPQWGGHKVLWHQDGGYTAGGDKSVDELRMVNVWTPLVPVNVDNGCMQFLPGTHKLGVVSHERREFYLEIAEEFLKPRLSEAVDVIVDPGDIVLFHNLLFHQGLPNRSPQIRWSLDWRYQDATQSTMRQFNGHIARSRSNPQSEIKCAEEWANCTFS